MTYPSRFGGVLISASHWVDPHTFWLTNGMCPLQSKEIPSLPSGLRLAVIP